MTTRTAPPRAALVGVAMSVVVAAAALAGCAGPAATPAAPVATTSVDLPKSYRFDPVAIEVRAGDTVTWTNHDDFTHNVTFPGEPGLDMRPGETVTRAFPTAGTFTYLCSFHPRDMNGSVTVTD